MDSTRQLNTSDLSTWLAIDSVCCPCRPCRCKCFHGGGCRYAACKHSLRALQRELHCAPVGVNHVVSLLWPYPIFGDSLRATIKCTVRAIQRTAGTPSLAGYQKAGSGKHKCGAFHSALCLYTSSRQPVTRAWIGSTPWHLHKHGLPCIQLHCRAERIIMTHTCSSTCHTCACAQHATQAFL